MHAQHPERKHISPVVHISVEEEEETATGRRRPAAAAAAVVAVAAGHRPSVKATARHYHPNRP